MKPLTQEKLATLARLGAVHNVFLRAYPEIDGGGWFLDVGHDDHALTGHVHAQRGGVRVFKTADAAIKAVAEAGYTGQIRVVMPTPMA